MSLLLILLAMLLVSSNPAPALGNEILVGGILNLTGPGSDVSRDYTLGMQDAFKFINENGGVYGQKIKLVYFDSGYGISEAYRRLKERGAKIIMGAGIGDAEAVASWLRRDAIPYVSPSLTPRLANPFVSRFNLSFAPDSSTAASGAIIAWFEKKWRQNRDYGKRRPKLACVYSLGNSHLGAGIKALKEEAKRLGIEVLPDVDVPLTATDTSAQIAQLMYDRPDVVWHGNTTISVASTLRASYALGFKADWIISPWGFDERLLRLAGEFSAGIMGVTPCAFYGQQYKNMDLVVEAAKKYSPDIPQSARLNKTIQAWCNAFMTVEALKRAYGAGDLTGPGILRNGFETLRNFDLRLGAAPVTFTAYDHRATSVSVLQELKQGKFQMVATVNLEERYPNMWAGRSPGETAGVAPSLPEPSPPPPPAKEKSITTPKWTPAKLVWNIWAADEMEGQFIPMKTLKLNSRYTIVLNFSALDYQTEGVHTEKVSGELLEHIEKYLNRKNDIELTAVLLPDLTYFKNPSRKDAVRDITIDLTKIRAIAQKGQVQYVDNIMAHLKENPQDPEFLFGKTKFEIETKGREGWGSIAIVLFKNNRPIDEITRNFCIGECKGTRPTITSTTRGFDSMRVATEKACFPDASMYFIELKKGILTGLFVTNYPRTGEAKGNYYSWDTEYNKTDFTTYLMNTLIPEIGRTTDDIKLRQIGEDMVGIFFPRTDTAGQKAYSAFKSFLKAASLRVFPGKRRPSIFVRVVTFGNDPPLLLPLGLMVTEVAPGKKDFLGRHFRFETPLQVQSYRVHERAPAIWVMLMPPENTESNLLRAREAMGETLDRWETGPGITSFQNMDEFGDWIRSKEESYDAPTALIVLSHQHRNKIYFRERESLISAALRRQFSPPSFSVLNGCGTGEPSAIDFIRRLNSLGVETIIATSSSVDGAMAGKFYQCMDKTLLKNRASKGYTVSDMYNDCVLDCLWKEKYTSSLGIRKEYGANALKYILLGNSNVMLSYPSHQEEK